MIKNNNIFINLFKVSKSLLFFVLLFCLLNFQSSLSYFSIFEVSTPSLISIVIYLCIVRLKTNPSNMILFFSGLFHDIMIGDNTGTTSIFLLLFKYFTERIILDKINKKNQEEWIYFTTIFIFSFSIIFLFNLTINFSVPQLSPIFFHVGITLILFPIIKIGVNIFSFVTRLIKS